MKHPSTKAPLVGVHRIIMYRSSRAEEATGSQNPGCCLSGSLNLEGDNGPLGELLCQGEPAQDPYFEQEDATEGDFGCDIHEVEDLEVARVAGLIGGCLIRPAWLAPATLDRLTLRRDEIAAGKKKVKHKDKQTVCECECQCERERECV